MMLGFKCDVVEIEEWPIVLAGYKWPLAWSRNVITSFRKYRSAHS